MKVSICIAFFCALLFPIQAQELKEKNVPTQVVHSFKTKYPDSYVYEWEWKRKKAVYEAEFMMNGKKYEAYFSSDGKWVRTEIELNSSEIPAVIQDSLSKTPYAGWKIDEVKKLESPEKESFYEIEVKSHSGKAYLYFLPNGVLFDKYQK